MSIRTQELQEDLGRLDKQSRAILDKAAEEKRPLTAEEDAEWDRLDAAVNTTTAEIDKRKRQAKRTAHLSESAGRVTEPADPQKPSSETTRPEVIEFDIGSAGKLRIEPGTPEHERAGDAYVQAWRNYLSTGVQAGLQVSPDTKGGYLTGTRFMAELIQAIDNQTHMRRLSRVLPPLREAVSLGVPSLDTDLADADWTPEVPASDLAEDDAMRFGKRELMPHLTSKLVKVSEKLLRSAVISAEEVVRERLAYKFGVTEEKAYLTGDGAQQPLGVFTASDDGISTGQDTTAAAEGAFTADELLDTKFAVKEGYWNGLTWLWHRDTLKRIRKLKDGNGQYLWSPGIAGGDPATVLDVPYVLSEYAPNTYTTGLYVAIIGDFKKYWIVDALTITILRLQELFQLRNQIGFIARKETDGMPVLEEAFQRLKLG